VLPWNMTNDTKTPPPPTTSESTTLRWQRFALFTDGRTAFKTTSCIYVQTDSKACPIRIGMSSTGLESRYRGGTGGAIDAAMHLSGGLVFIAAVAENLCGVVEKELIWRYRQALIYNRAEKKHAPAVRVAVVHEGDVPQFVDET
jgi:hypothetical protein